MSHATAHTISLQGAHGHLIDVQADLSDGTVQTTMVGRPDTSISEARDRCRAAVTNSGYTWPNTKRVTVLLSPADLRKSGPHFDLAIAVAVLGAGGTFKPEATRGTAFIGELTLDGRLRAVPGVLPMAMAAAAAGLTCVIVPDCQVEEAVLVPDLMVLGVRSLQQVVAILNDHPVPDAPPVASLPTLPGITWRGESRLSDLDMADVQGMPDARYAVEVASAGGHHLMLSGPKGAGKTTLAERIPGLLPDLTLEQALELTCIHSVAGTLPAGKPVLTRPPFRAPHHSATRASVVGGGTGRTRPGEISQALHGVLFLDEFPLFQGDIIESFRQPLESAEITIARGEETATYPARTMFVLAANPCPCGDFHPASRDHRCTCTEVQRRRYRGRLSGPITDRIDITRHIEPVRPHELNDPLARPESTQEIRTRVVGARDRQAARYAGTDWRLNSDVPGPALRERWPLSGEAQRELDRWLYTGRLTHRGSTRVHRLAWTVADLLGVEQPGLREVETAVQLRTGEPLALEALRREVLG
ncbi:MAG TPA: YifB family Mg chelatase-like AAA ATPase [Nocardioidaceae bacterium]|nr:YifB family Mg chelatase-like AAA ATPase [Nocardioidaceae bacterium]